MARGAVSKAVRAAGEEAVACTEAAGLVAAAAETSAAERGCTGQSASRGEGTRPCKPVRRTRRARQARGDRDAGNKFRLGGC